MWLVGEKKVVVSDISGDRWLMVDGAWVKCGWQVTSARAGGEGETGGR